MILFHVIYWWLIVFAKKNILRDSNLWIYAVITFLNNAPTFAIANSFFQLRLFNVICCNSNYSLEVSDRRSELSRSHIYTRDLDNSSLMGGYNLHNS